MNHGKEPADFPDAKVLAARADDCDTMGGLTATYLTDLDARVDGLVARLREHMTEYSAVPATDISVSTTAIVRSVLEHIAVHSDAPDARRIAALTELARRRVDQGFPLEALTRSIQLTARFVLEGLDQEAARRDTPVHVVLRTHDIAWEFANDAAGVIADIRREMAIDEAGRAAELRVTFLRAVVHGQISIARLSAEAHAFGLSLSVQYYPLRARATDSRDLAALSATVIRTGATGEHRPLLAVIDGDLVGVAPQRPVVDDRWLVALADPGPLPDLAPLFAQTLSTLDVARAFRRTGVITATDLGPLPLALSGSETARALEKQHFSSLDDGQIGRGDVETTVWAYLDNDRSLDRTAAELHVHRNTVRYRLTKFEELTHLDIRRTRDLVLVWWLLAHRRAHRA